MKTIILFNDNSPEAANAGMLALSMARKIKADILLLDLCTIPLKAQKVFAGAANGVLEDTESENLAVQLESAIDDDNDFKPVITEFDASNYTEKDIIELVIRKNSWMMIKGIQTHVTHDVLSGINVQSIINRVACPLLLVPDNFTRHEFKNITYAVDMRYCRTAILRFLAELAQTYNANLVVEHFSAKGLPHLSDDYATDLYTNEVKGKIKYEKVYFNNIKERNLGAAVDVMVDNLHADLLALVNHRFHFEELFGRSINNVMPEHVPIPVIIFPL